jgi:DNA-directed RNA polymerase specialized sigma24 family protein
MPDPNHSSRFSARPAGTVCAVPPVSREPGPIEGDPSDAQSPGGATFFLAEAYDRHGTEVYGLAHQIVGPAAAGEVTVAAFVALRRAAGTTGWVALPARAFLLAFAHREVVARLRCDAERARQLAEMSAPEVEHEAWQRAGPTARELLRHLSTQERCSLLLAYFGGHDRREISAILGRAEDAVTSDLRVALDHLGELRDRAGT